jgi:uncharacterized protein YkwD
MKRILQWLFFTSILFLVLFLLVNFLFPLPRISQNFKKIENLTPKVEIKTEPQVFTPPPLKVETKKEGFLTQRGIIVWTNIYRKDFGLKTLKENEILDQSAKLKLEDMFKNQYFAHKSPEGIELKDLMKDVNYKFIVIGENLAMGNFENDKELVDAWMKSEGHRENILNERFEEIGVAVKKGIFEGREVWIAVQHFGKPLSACQKPDEDLKKRIENNETKLDEMEKELLSLKEEIEKKVPKWMVKEKIKEYNDLVNEYNLLLKETQDLISQYNQQVESFNNCLSQ